MDDIIDWDALKSPSKSVDEACPNCKSTNTALQSRRSELRGVTRSNIHCRSCGWGWGYIHEGHDRRRRWRVLNLKRDLGEIDFGEVDDDELAEWRELVEAVDALAERYGIDYPLETFEDK